MADTFPWQKGVFNPILPGLLNTRWNGGEHILPSPPNSLGFYPRSIKFGM